MRASACWISGPSPSAGRRIEEAPEHPGHRRVTFVYRAGDQVDGAWLRTPCAWFEKGGGALQRIPGTDIWFAGWVVSQGLRASYGFIVRKVGEEIDLEEPEVATDPLAENQQVVDWGPEQEASSNCRTAALACPARVRLCCSG